MKRNTLFGGLALMAAGGVIGAGAMISSNAMADTSGAAPTDQMTMISIGDDGEAVQCTFEGADLDGLLPPLPAGVPEGATSGGIMISSQAVHADRAGDQAGDQPSIGQPVVGHGVIISATGDLPVLSVEGLPEGVEAAGGTITVNGATIDGLPADGQIVTGVPTGALPVLTSADEARDGTAEESAAMHDEAVEMASTMPADGTVIASSAATKP